MSKQKTSKTKAGIRSGNPAIRAQALEEQRLRQSKVDAKRAKQARYVSTVGPLDGASKKTPKSEYVPLGNIYSTPEGLEPIKSYKGENATYYSKMSPLKKFGMMAILLFMFGGLVISTFGGATGTPNNSFVTDTGNQAPGLVDSNGNPIGGTGSVIEETDPFENAVEIPIEVEDGSAEDTTTIPVTGEEEVPAE